MAFFGFIKGYTQAKSETAGSSIVQMIAGWDPEGASEADIKTMNSNLDKLIKEATIASQEAAREQKEADAINKLYNDMLAGIEVLEEQKKTADEHTTTVIDAVILEELTKLESMQGDIAREEAEAVEAAEYKAELDALCRISADKLKNARKQLSAAKTNMKRAEVREKRASEKAARASQLAGITKDMDKMSSALGAMNAKAEEAHARAEGHEMKAKLLKSSDSANSIMADAMKKAAGVTTPTMSVAERLAALKKK